MAVPVLIAECAFNADAGVAYREAVLAGFPAGYWRLGDAAPGTNPVDSSGNVLTATKVGTVTFAVAGALTGDLDTAATFDGATGYLTAANALGVPGAWTIEAWYKTSSAAANQCILYQPSGAGLGGPLMRVDAGVLSVWVVDSGGNFHEIQDSAASNNGAWHHAVATWDGATLRLYRDGVQVASGTFSITEPTTAGAATNIGAIAGTPSSQFFNGQLDEVAIYKTALTADTVAYHYEARNVLTSDRWTWTDLVGASKVKKVTTFRGRKNEQDHSQTGTIGISTTNGDRALEPGFTGSPYYPNVLPEKPIRVRAGLVVQSFDFESGVPGGFAGTGGSVLATSATSHSGAASMKVTFPAGFGGLNGPNLSPDGATTYRAQVWMNVPVGKSIHVGFFDGNAGIGYSVQTVNGTGAFQLVTVPDTLLPATTLGYWFFDDIGAGGYDVLVDDMLVVKTQPVIGGNIEALPEDWLTPTYGEIELSASDILALLNGDEGVTFVAPVELSGARIKRLAQAIGIPPAKTSIDAGGFNVQAQTLVSENALAHAQDIEITEAGFLFAGKDYGTLVFKDKSARTLSHQASLATFGDADDGSEYPYTKLSPSFDNSWLYNDVHVQANGLAEQIASDPVSRRQYRRRSLPLSTLHSNTSDALSAAQLWLLRYLQPLRRIDSMTVTLTSQSPAQMIVDCLALDLGQRITIVRRPGGVGNPVISVQCNVESIAWNIDVQKQTWEMTLQLSPADSTVYWSLGTVGASELGTTTRLAP